MVAASETAVTPRRPLIGIALKVMSVTIFVGMQSCIKAAGDVPAGQIVFFRSFFAMIPILAMVAWQHELTTAFRTKRPFSHVARGLFGVASMGLGFYGLTKIPLPEWVTLNYAQPLLIVVFSALFMGEVVRIFRWTAVAIGFVGVVIVAWPNLTLISGGNIGSGEASGVIAVLCGAAISAVAILLVRRLVYTEKSATIVLWFSVTATVVGLLTFPFGWAMLTSAQAAFLVGAGICGGIAQIFMTESYRHADMSTVAPFEYTSLILAIAVGYFVFGDLPTIYTIVGGSIIVFAGLLIIWREHRLGLERGAARKLVPPQG